MRDFLNPVRRLLVAGCVGAALCGGGAGEAAAQAAPFQPAPFGYAGPVGIAGAPWGWWTTGQPIVAPAIWVEPVGLAWSSGAQGSMPLRYGPVAPMASSGPQVSGVMGVWSSSRFWGAAPSPFALNWSSPHVLNGGVFHVW